MIKVLAIFTTFLFVGCAVKTEFIEVPTKCKIEKPKQQNYNSEDEVAFVKSLTIYTEKLESALEFCIGER